MIIKKPINDQNSKFQVCLSQLQPNAMYNFINKVSSFCKFFVTYLRYENILMFTLQFKLMSKVIIKGFNLSIGIVNMHAQHSTFLLV